MSTVFLAENFYDNGQFLDHTVTANEEEADHEAFRVGTQRRSRFNYWAPTTTNSEAWIEVKCDTPRAADTLVIDRGHNLDTHEIKLQISDDNFSSTQTLVDTTVFDTPQPSSRLTAGGAMEDGAWAIRFDEEVATYWRLLIPAMGTDLKPNIVGLYLGKSYEPGFSLERPFGFGDRRVDFDEAKSPTAWVAATRTTRRKERDVSLKLSSFDEFEQARYHIEGLYFAKNAMWFWPDKNFCERGWLASVPRSRVGFETAQEWGFQQAQVPLVEHEPELL